MHHACMFKKEQKRWRCVHLCSGQPMIDELTFAQANSLASCLVLSCVLANTPMESNGQGWGAWSSLVKMC